MKALLQGYGEYGRAQKQMGVGRPKLGSRKPSGAPWGASFIARAALTASPRLWRLLLPSLVGFDVSQAVLHPSQRKMEESFRVLAPPPVGCVAIGKASVSLSFSESPA